MKWAAARNPTPPKIGGAREADLSPKNFSACSVMDRWSATPCFQNRLLRSRPRRKLFSKICPSEVGRTESLTRAPRNVYPRIFRAGRERACRALANRFGWIVSAELAQGSPKPEHRDLLSDIDIPPAKPEYSPLARDEYRETSLETRFGSKPESKAKTGEFTEFFRAGEHRASDQNAQPSVREDRATPFDHGNFGAPETESEE